MKRRTETKSPERSNRILAGILLAVGFVFIVLFVTNAIPGEPTKVVDLTGWSIETVDSDPARMRGLSEREYLGDNEGMLFVFDSPGIYPFWMKEMKFPLDIVWINGGKVVDVTTLRAPTYDEKIPPSHIPLARADLVLEINAGKAAELGLKKGAYVILP